MSDSPDLTLPSPPASVKMLEIICGFWISRTIYVAAKIGLADHIKDSPRTVQDLASATGTNPASLYRVLRALASVGVFIEDEAGRFGPTPLSETLRSDVQGSMRALAMAELGQEHFTAWGNLMHSVKTGEIAFDNHFKQNVWEYYAQNPEDGHTFNQAMRGMTQTANQMILEAYDFSGVETIADIGGGTGSLLSAVLAAYPSMRGILFDLPHVIAEAGPILTQTNVRDRAELQSGDFFSSVPTADAYLLKFIIHDWDDDQSITILKRCRQAVGPAGRLLLLETIVPPRNEPSFSKFIDLNMMVMTGGQERTETEFADLFEKAGWRLTRVIPTNSIFYVIEATPV
jgi:hypothetical protein